MRDNKISCCTRRVLRSRREDLALSTANIDAHHLKVLFMLDCQTISIFERSELQRSLFVNWTRPHTLPEPLGRSGQQRPDDVQRDPRAPRAIPSAAPTALGA